MHKSLIFIFAIIFCYSQTSFAAMAGNTSDPKIPYGDGIANLKDTIGSVKVSGDAEWILHRDLKSGSDVASPEFDGEWYLLKFGYPILDRFEPYVEIGMSNLKTKWTQNNVQINVRSESDLAWGIGGKVLLFEVPENRFRFTLNGQYKYTDPGIRRAQIASAERSISASEFKVSEWQIGGIVSLEFPLHSQRSYLKSSDIYSLIPYAGLAYTDSDSKVKFTSGGTNYDIGNAENDKKVVVITGCDFVTPQNCSVNIEGRFVGETSLNGGATLKF